VIFYIDIGVFDWCILGIELSRFLYSTRLIVQLFPFDILISYLVHYFLQFRIIPLQLLDIDIQHSLTVRILIKLLVQVEILNYVISRVSQQILTIIVK